MAITTYELHSLQTLYCTGFIKRDGRSILAPPVRLVCGHYDGAGVRWSTTTAPGSVQGADEQVW
jgi:hypothetical protein